MENNAQFTIHIAIADSDQEAREEISKLLAACGGFVTDIEAASGEELISRLKTATILPDICVIEIAMKGRKGYEILKEIKTVSASMKVLVFTAIHKEEAIMYMLKYGASGYLVKDIHFGELAKALRAVHEKGQYIGVSAIDSLLHSTIDWQENHNAITEAEMRFLSFCCDDTVYKEIAGKTGVSPRTIEKYRDSLFKKLKIRTKTGLATFAMDMGFSPH